MTLNTPSSYLFLSSSGDLDLYHHIGLQKELFETHSSLMRSMVEGLDRQHSGEVLEDLQFQTLSPQTRVCVSSSVPLIYCRFLV